ncbi:hypothetical protein ACR820_27015 [Streptomyces netropsis]
MHCGLFGERSSLPELLRECSFGHAPPNEKEMPVLNDNGGNHCLGLASHGDSLLNLIVTASR